MVKWNGYLYKLCGCFWKEVWSETRPYFIKLFAHFVIFSLTLSALLLAQIVFKATQDVSRILFIDSAHLMIVIYISDLMSFTYFLYYLNKEFFPHLPISIKKIKFYYNRSWFCMFQDQ